jgi:uncharacterized protein
MRFPDARILVMAKAPVPGQVKTRLISSLGPEGAAALHGRLLEDVVRRLTAARVAPLELWCAPDPAAEVFTRLAGLHGCSLHAQEGADLGERMCRAAAGGLDRARAVVLVGCDCPSLDGDYVAQALDALARHEAVLGPAEDGGYVLLGLRRAAPELFTGLPWGTERVAEITRERMRGLGWRWSEQPVLWDLDRPEDLVRYRARDGELSPAGG